MNNLQELKRLALAATEGPWEVYFETGIAPMITTFTENKDGYRSLGKLVASWPCRKRQNFVDMEYVAAANPQQILLLISKLETCIEALERVADNGGPNQGMGYTNAQCAREALSKIRRTNDKNDNTKKP